MNTPDSPYRLLTLPEAAEFMRISDSQLRALIREGRCPLRPIVVSERVKLLPLWGLVEWASREAGVSVPDAPDPVASRHAEEVRALEQIIDAQQQVLALMRERNGSNRKARGDLVLHSALHGQERTP